MARKQRDLTKAGAWIYDVNNQERTYNALTKSYQSAARCSPSTLLRAPADGKVLAVNPIVGSYISRKALTIPIRRAWFRCWCWGPSQTRLNVRCYVDEILVPRLPDPSKMTAQMSVRGSNVKVPLKFVRTQPFISPKIELADQKLERVDVRVLPVIFHVELPKGLTLYPGQLVDVYIRGLIMRKTPLASPRRCWLLLSGCNIGPKYTKPSAPVAGGVQGIRGIELTAQWRPAQPSDDLSRGKWWERFHDAELNALEDKLNISNQNIAAAAASVQMARAAIREAQSQYFPTVTANPRITNARYLQRVRPIRRRELSPATRCRWKPPGSRIYGAALRRPRKPARWPRS